MNKFLIAGVLSLGLGLSGCMSMQSESALDDALQSLKGSSNKTNAFVEAFFEYTGPADKWAGPSTFLMHVVAKDQGPAQVTVVPPLFGDPFSKEDGPVNTTRAPASAKPLTGELAREQLTQLAGIVEGSEDLPFRGCLSPVRVRLVRVDGALVEKQGCRTYRGWPKAVSEAVSQFVASGIVMK
ncbi:MAG: hypothetical protein NDJ90_15060 [Oligoflexia bacterium]|nr:hypothetical protein [Oligoflexia bacterium]